MPAAGPGGQTGPPATQSAGTKQDTGSRRRGETRPAQTRREKESPAQVTGGTAPAGKQRRPGVLGRLAGEIHLPEPGQFHSPGLYYSTAFHEMADSTGHETG